jgi:pimeloyl-ACP methyl ester carboxylesterase
VARASFKAALLGGWVEGRSDGERLLVLHGGPGLSFDYMDGAAEELIDGYRVASFQQRGLAPSAEEGPFTVDQAVADVVAVLDGLEWERAHLVGHSWGGHLSFHCAARIPERVLGALAVDPLGAVGDGGMASFGEELAARIPKADRDRAQALDDAAMTGAGTEAEAVESLGLLWPGYFADPATAPAMPALRMSLAAYAGIMSSVVQELPSLEAALPAIGVPVGVLVGARSPIPMDEAGLLTAARIPGAWVQVLPDVGHFPWIEAPGSLRAAVDRLAAGDRV